MDERARELDGQAQAALKERERLNRSLTQQRRLRKAQRELEEAQLISTFAGSSEGTRDDMPVQSAMPTVDHQ